MPGTSIYRTASNASYSSDSTGADPYQFVGKLENFRRIFISFYQFS